MATITAHNQDVLDWSNKYTGPKFHALICDPPYALKYNQKKWDNDIALQTDTWHAISSHLLPGAFGVAYAAPQKYHRLAIAIEDAGFRIHPFLLNWFNTQGIPRATEAAPGYYYGGQVLRNTIEPILLFQLPTKTPKPTFNETGSGALNITSNSHWPQNTIVGCSLFCTTEGHDPICPVVQLGQATDHLFQSHWDAEVWERVNSTLPLKHIPKATREERDLFLDKLPSQTFKRVNDGGLANNPRFAPIQVKNFHPTVKPIVLGAWLGKLLLPPKSGNLLNPFSGSGSEAIGTMIAGWDRITTIEQDQAYYNLCRERTKVWKKFITEKGKETVYQALLNRRLRDLVESSQQELFTKSGE